MITTRDEKWLINDDRGTVKNQIGYFRPLASTPIIVYIWCLPYLSTIGFTEANSTSISGFIANAHATGALAALSFRPLNLMWEYQYSIVSRIDQGKGKTVLEWTMASYQFFYGGFLVCTVNYVPNWLHTTTVTLFIMSFMFHSIMTLYFTSPKLLGKIELIIGVLSCACLPFAKGIWFWGFECVGYTMMMLFTPTEILCLPSV